MTLSKFKTYREVILILAVLLLTIILAVWQHYGLNHSLVIDSFTEFPMHTVDDRSNRGKSRGKYRIEDDKIILHCNIKHSKRYAYPYCEIVFDLQQATNVGTDLSQFDEVGFWIHYSQPTESSIRIQTRNFHADYSQANNDGTFKYNALQYRPHETQYPTWVDMSVFQVATWWLVQNNIPLEHSGPDFSNTILFEVATGDGIKPGEYQIVIERIEFKGKLIDKATMYLWIIIMWSSFAVGLIAYYLTKLTRSLREGFQREQELVAINALLNVKSKRLEYQANRDELTGVLNRTGLKDIFYQTIEQGKSQHLSLIFMDIDHFKSINDNHGHEVGDIILKEFGELVQSSTRERDLLARWGGEEFILACPNTYLMQAANLAEEIRLIIERNHWHDSLPITCSFGVAQIKESENPTDLIRRADAALYQAKANGRNCVSLSEDSKK